MKKPIVLLLCGFSVIILLSLTLRPVPVLPENELTITSGTVSQILEGAEHDIVFRLKETNEVFYINRGLEQGLKLEVLRGELLGSQIVLKYPEYWSLLNRGDTHHISKIEHKGKTIFSELD